MNDIVTEKELQEARLKVFTPGGAQVLGQLWWKELQKLTGAYGQLDVLHDFISAMFYTLQGKIDELPKLPCLAGVDYEKRLTVMRRAMIFLGEAMERERFRDILGAADQELRGTKSQSGTGAFYTPDSVCDVMAAMTGSENDPVKEKLERGEIVTVYDPTVGAGRTLLSFVAKHQNHIDLIRAFGTDIEINAVRMFYVNCALNGIAARCVHGNELSNDREWAVYYTPEWHVYEAERRAREQARMWRTVFATLSNTQEQQEEPEAPETGKSTPHEENAQDGAAGREKMDVVIEENGQLAFNF
jgi:type I restriction-modification system DNA methylase subunit